MAEKTAFFFSRHASPIPEAGALDADTRSHARVSQKVIHVVLVAAHHPYLHKDAGPFFEIDPMKKLKVAKGIEPARYKLALLELARRLGSVNEACRLLGYSRQSYYRFERLYAAGGANALQTSSRKRPLLKNRLSAEVERAVLQASLQEPALGAERLAAQLRKQGVKVSGTGIRGVWSRHGLQTQLKRSRHANHRLDD